MASKLYSQLLAETRKIENQYLYFKKDLSGSYSRRKLSATAAYTVFCHAEIESYLEGWSNLIVDKAESRWKAGKLSKPLVHLCQFLDPPSLPSAVPTKDIWSEFVFKALAKQKANIRANHGIKEKNICSLFAPVGFDIRNIDTVLLGDLSAFGVLRGDYAHNSHRIYSRVSIDPFDRKMKVQGIVSLLNVLDNDLRSFINSV